MLEHFFRKHLRPRADDKGFDQKDREGLAQFLGDMVKDPAILVTMTDTATGTAYYLTSRDKSFQATVTINKHPIKLTLKSK